MNLTKIKEFEDEYRFLSNFAYAPIMYEGLEYMSVESAYQAAKTKDRDIRLRFTNLGPNEAKREGRKLDLREDWEDVKIHVMYTCLKEKFRDRVMAKKLLATGDSILIEGNTWHDNIWGNCTCMNCLQTEGTNYLGRLLMLVRKELRDEC